mmetsp:Transcript_3262/g.4523  ORF Transcript_3262/g.4523 Transcript_3262/m.4523 type:complete len:122 (-) Transcript_3262:321-686(-)
MISSMLRKRYVISQEHQIDRERLPSPTTICCPMAYSEPIPINYQKTKSDEEINYERILEYELWRFTQRVSPSRKVENGNDTEESFILPTADTIHQKKTSKSSSNLYRSNDDPSLIFGLDGF